MKKLLLMAVLVLACVASAQTGTWTLYPPQPTLNSVEVLQPINADGTSVFKSNGNAVIPVKLTLSTALGPAVFQSIGSNAVTSDDYSVLSFKPSPALTVSQITNLRVSYAFTTGNCHGGALRWSMRTAKGNLFIYYGASPNFGDCTASSQSDVNMVGLSDMRYDTSQVGGTFYDTYDHAMTLVGNEPVSYVALVLDGGWAGDQVMTLSSAAVNTDVWTPSPSGDPTPTCALPPATVKITKTEGTGAGTVDEPESIQPADNDSQFRVVSCTYMYNLATGSLSGAGGYKVEAVIGGAPASGAAIFSLK